MSNEWPLEIKSLLLLLLLLLLFIYYHYYYYYYYSSHGQQTGSNKFVAPQDSGVCSLPDQTKCK